MPTLDHVPPVPRQLARTRRFGLGVPGGFTVSPDGGTVYFLRTRAGDDPASGLWSFDRVTGEERLLVDPLSLLADAEEQLSDEERVLRERARQMSSGIVSYATDRDCSLVVFALSGRLWTYRPADGRPPQELPTRRPVLDPRPDPTGARIAYVSGGALRVIEAEGTRDRAVAEPDGPEVMLGLPEHVAAESMDRHRGHWWSPDGSHLLYARVDTAPVQRWYVADPADPARPPVSFPYPAAGTANADVTLWIASAEPQQGTGLPPTPLTPPSAPARRQVDWDTAEFEYLTAAGWDVNGPYAAVQSRSQRHLRLLGIDARTGATRTLAEQHDDAWIQLVPGLPARTASGRVVTAYDSHGSHGSHGSHDGSVGNGGGNAEASAYGTRFLAVDGHPVTPPGLQLAEVLGVDGEQVLFTASYEPTEMHLWTYEPGAGVRQLSPDAEPGVHTGSLRAGTLVLTSRTPNRSGAVTTVSTLRPASATGVTAATAPSVTAPSVTAPSVIASRAELPLLQPRMELLKLGPKALRGHLFLPSWHRPGDAPLPVLMDPYGGPALCKVRAEQAWWTYVSQWFADHGFAVLAVDGRGTPGRGPGWERAVHLDIATPVLDDQVEALAEAARLRPELDTGRVGIRGWSFGGYLAALAVLRRPDVFHAAVAGAPVTDQRLYDTHWRERHLGHPDEHPEAYDHCSPVHDAARLTRPLLLVHGLADDNVFAAHTLRLSAALLAAGRPHEVLPLPRTTHLPTDERIAENLLTHQLDFLRRSLGVERRLGAEG
ncbi:prolyl oligopeptidase family serine peptidase [Streptomyces sp. NA04227]|uniref:S9 family peptidase n=1 Tax=Streptomyces sp. NA04227 TaxID=2742136 RepID=UPI0015907C6D|nr:prolyl oligopeptidase family serine peptidase [Streptomyces sp. NA04227]QKW08230.1 prolyl oligopeptidase family serine peptidase [Streptomyces sp. NA04227]